MGKYFLALYYAYLPIPFLNDLFNMGEIVFIDTLPDAFAEVLVADPRSAHITSVELSIGIQRRSLSFYPTSHQVTVEACPGEKTMDQHERQAGQSGRDKGGGPYHDTAEDRAEHNDDDVVKGCLFAEGADAGDTDQRKRKEKANEGAAAHLKAIEVFAFAEQCMQNIHHGVFWRRKANIGPVF